MDLYQHSYTLPPKRLCKEPKLAISILKRKFIEPIQDFNGARRTRTSFSPQRRMKSIQIRQKSAIQTFNFEVGQIIVPKRNSRVTRFQGPNFPFNLNYLIKQMNALK
ncbi:unnamed protein product [Paramecium pentaurelia]|uniref:Uncharacterized protein n=1 Tax=Paramecium pentaurelia TaxID=43138 RepID=A0A8S1U2C0_9CILI|nr:unnamed protein product [Paramecium pentaurelia]